METRTLSGTLTNDGTLTADSLSLAGGTLTNSGTATSADGITCTSGTCTLDNTGTLIWGPGDADFTDISYPHNTGTLTLHGGTLTTAAGYGYGAYRR